MNSIDIIKIFLIITPMTYTILLSILPLLTGELEYYLILFNFFIFGHYSNKIEKKIFKLIQGKKSKIGRRPNPLGSKFGNKYDKCSVPINIFKPWKLKLVDKDYFDKKKNTPSWGFPSGHAQETSYIATILSLYFINKNIKNKFIYIVLLWLVNILVIFQRIESGCHTILQVIVGNLFGIFLGLLSYYQICNRFFPKNFPIKNSNKFLNIFNLNT